jgi:hypothetical protein
LPNHRTILGGSRNSPWHPKPIIDCTLCTVYIFRYTVCTGTGGARTLGPVCGVVSTLQFSGSGHLQDWFHTPPSVCLPPHPFHTDNGSSLALNSLHLYTYTFITPSHTESESFTALHPLLITHPSTLCLNLSHLLTLKMEVSQPSILCLYPTPFILTMENPLPSTLYLNPILHTWIGDSCFTFDGS